MQPEIYTLPTVSFVGGSTQELRFRLKDKFGGIIDATGFTGNFAVCDYRFKDRTYLFQEDVSFINDENKIKSILKVVVHPASTRSMYGKFVYQITIKDAAGKIGIPNQGIMNITKNIDQDFR